MTSHTALSVDEAGTAVGQISDGARTQTSQLNMVSTALNETFDAIKLVTSNAVRARERAEGASHAVESGQNAVGQLVPIVEAIAQNSRKITQITQVIAQIATARTSSPSTQRSKRRARENTAKALWWLHRRSESSRKALHKTPSRLQTS
jgi:3-oxoacyl-ACP reductase-like protein